MKRSLVGALAVAAVGLLSGCGADPGREAVDENGAPILYATSAYSSLEASPTLASPKFELLRPQPPKGEPIGRDDPKSHGQFSPLDAHLSALALATLKCKGSLDPDDYDASNGMLTPRFQGCPRDEKQIENIKNILAVQIVDRSAGEYFARLRLEAQKNFPRNAIPVCPTWELLQTFNPPNEGTTSKYAGGGIGKSNNLFRVKSQICNGAECAVSHAQQCSAGSGSQWWIRGDYSQGTVITDPVWWLDDTDFPPGTDPFFTAGYYHAMSYYGVVPGAVYGSVHRVNEPCSKYYGGYHYKVSLKPVWCSSDWMCLTECR